MTRFLLLILTSTFCFLTSYANSISHKPTEKVSLSMFNNWASSQPNLNNFRWAQQKSTTDKLGITHVTYAAYYNEIPVTNAVLKAHFKNGNAFLINGDIPDFSRVESKTQVSYSKVVASFQNIIPTHKQELVYAENKGTLSLCYKVTVEDKKIPSKKLVFVSAKNGVVIHEEEQIKHSDVNGVATTKYSGVQTIVTDSVSPTLYRLIETGRGGGIETYNYQQGFFGGVDFEDDDNDWNNVNTQQDEVATDAHWATEMYYDYLASEFGRNSVDDAGQKLITNVHYGSNYNSAFWDGTVVSVGDGDGTNYGPLATVDIVSHEFTHGLIDASAGFVFSYEPGALSESFSDIFATAVEHYAKAGSANFTIQEDASPTGIPTRSLADPNAYSQPHTYLGNFWATGGADNGGVHTNGGVQNYWFYLLCNGGTGTNDNGDFYSVTPIGMDSAMAIVYRALVFYHTSNSQYAEARAYSIQAAEDLFGACSPKVEQVTNAWYAVGVGAAFTNAPATAGFTSDITFSCTVPTTIVFSDLSTNASSYKWFFGDGDSSITANAAHTYTAAGTYTVQQIVTGTGCANTPDTLTLTNYITITNGDGPKPVSCSPEANNPNGSYGIRNFSFQSINNTSSMSDIESYVDYSCALNAFVDSAGTYNFNVSTGNEYAYIWLDSDSSGSFDSSELLYSASTRATVHTGSFSIPTNTPINVALRLRIASSFYNLALDGCGIPDYGQYEDYSLTAVSSNQAPVASFFADNTSLQAGGVANYQETSTSSPTSWEWEFEGGIPATSTAQNPAVVYNNVGLYYTKLIVANGYGSDTITQYNYVSVSNTATLCSGTTSSASIGTLFDSGGEFGDYSDGENCTFLIIANCVTPITLNFSSFNLESGFDYLSVYDGTSTAGTELFNGSGSTIPSNLVATSGNMFIQFTSDGSVQYSGFEANWTIQPTSASIYAGFEPDTAVIPFNTLVQFTDTSIGQPFNWTWDFGDGNTATDQNPTHSYQTHGTYTVTLIATNCNTSDTTSSIINVLPPPSISVTEDSIVVVSTSCADTTLVPVTVYNTGGGDLNFNTIGGTVNGAQNLLYDGFESGNINDWILEAGSYSKQVVTTNPASGSYCLEFTNGTSNHMDGISQTFGPDTATSISFDIKNSTTSEYGSFVVIGNNPTSTSSGALLYMYMTNAGTYYINGSTPSSNYVANQWCHVELTNINWTTKTFDVEIDGTPVLTSENFQDFSLTEINEVHLYTWSNTSSCYFDNVIIGGNSVFAESTITTTPDSAIVAAGDSVIVNVEFISTGLVSNTYLGELVISSNDTANSLFTIPYSFTVDGEPTAELATNSCLDFDTLFNNLTKTDSIMLYNNGCDTLFIGGSATTSAVFSNANNSFFLTPFDSLLLHFDYAPTSSGTYQDTIYFNGNDSFFVCLSGVSVGPPIVATNPTDITETITGCNDSITVPLWIYNNGDGTLGFNASAGSTSSAGSAFFDGFESGNINTWTTLGSYPVSVTSNSAATGNYALELTTGASSHLDGISHSFADDTPTEISFKMQSNSTSAYGSFIVIGDNPTSSNDPMLYFFMSNNGTFYVNGNSGVGSYTANTWINVELLNINWISKTMDLYIDGNLVLASLSFQNTSVSTLNTVHLYTWATTATCWVDDLSIGEPVLGNTNWLTLTPDTGNVVANDSLLINVSLYSNGLTEGEYISEITVNSNDPFNPTIQVPCTLTVVGEPTLTYNSSPCTSFDTLFIGNTSTDSVSVYNTGCDTLFVTSVITNTANYSGSPTSGSVLPNDSMVFYIDFNPSTAGSFEDTLNIFTNDGVAQFCLEGNAIAGPEISVLPTSISVTLNACGDSATQTLAISNNGGSTLDYTILGTENDTLEVLAMTYGVDYGDEYTKALQAVDLHYNAYNLTETNTTSSTVLQAELVGKDLLFIAEQESGVSSVFTPLSTVLNNFVNNGGTVIMLGTSANSYFFDSGLFTGTNGTSITTGVNLTTLNASHPLLAGTTAPIAAQNATYSLNIADANAVRLLEYTGQDIVTYKPIGAGNVVFIAFDYWGSDANASTILANAFQWAQSNSELADWITVDSDTGSIATSSIENINVSFNSSNLAAGNYTSEIVIESNDATDPQISVPVSLTVLSNPCAAFSTTTSLCNGQVDFFDETTNVATSWEWNFGDGSFATTQNPTHTYLATGTYQIMFIACNSTSCDTLVESIFVQNIGAPTAANCEPAATNPQSNYGITQVLFNDINSNTGYTFGEDYQDLTCTYNSTIYEDSTYQLDVSTGFEYVYAWIDYNNDNMFDVSERIYTATTRSTVHSISVTIPNNAVENNALRMRVMSTYFTVTSACDLPTYGQVEDYAVVITPGIQSPPNAGFELNQLSTCAGIISLADTSTIFPDSWIWSFGDGNTSSLQHPTQEYSDTGTYTVQLIACNFVGCDTTTQQVTIGAISELVAPACRPATLNYCCDIGIHNVDFNTISNATASGIDGYQDYSCMLSTTLIENQTYQLTVTTGPNYDEYCAAWIDYNNDGAFDITEQVMNSGPATNSHTTPVSIPVGGLTNTPLRLRIMSDFNPISTTSCDSVSYGQAEDYMVTLIANNQPPVAQLVISNVDSCAGVVDFTDISSNSPTSWEWNFGDGTTSTLQNPSHNYDTSGVFSVMLIATNSFGTDTAYTTISINLPTANFSFTNNLYVGEVINFTDLSANAQSWTWNFGNSNASTAPNPFTIYNDTGLYEVTLIITSGAGCKDTISHFLYIENPAAPVANYTATIDTCNRSISFSDLSTNGPTSWMWNFGDGTSSTQQNPTHTYSTGGSYYIVLNASNSIGSDDYYEQVTIPAGSATFAHTGPYIADSPVQFNATTTDIASITWDFGDGYSASIEDPQHIYLDSGSFIVTLNTVDVYGCQNSVSDTIHVVLKANGLNDLSTENSFEIYPNPNNGSFTLKLHSDNYKFVSITNIVGQEVFRSQLTKQSERVQVNGLSTGTYTISISDNKGQLTNEIIVVK